MKLQGKVALVTGGSRGIGAAIARRLAADGASVALTYVSSRDKAEAVVRSIEAAGGKAVAMRCDNADANAVASTVRQTAEMFGKLDILVNNAGVFIPGALNDPGADTEALKRQFQINVIAVAAAAREAANHLSENGRVITIGSGLADSCLWPGLAEYSGTKAAVAAFARGWARDLGPKGITVNVVQPGPIDTDMNPESSDFAEAQKAANALGRYGKPEDVAAAVSFLAGPEAGFITGATLNVDGGFAV